MGKRKLVYLIIIIAVVAGGVLGFVYRDKVMLLLGGKKLLMPPSNLTIKTYSLSGEVVSVQNDSVVFKAALVYQTLNGNTVEYQEKTALVGKNTKISMMITAAAYQTIGLSDIKPGMMVNVYYSSSPLEVSKLQADRIEVISK